MKILLSLFLCLVSGLISAKSVNKFIIFGDSLSDNGNLYEYTQQKIPPSPPYFEGRFSNGSIWIEQLIDLYSPPKKPGGYLANYAFGGAGVEDNLHGNLFTLNQEIETYFLANEGVADPKSLYFVWIGANNYLGGPSDIGKEIQKVNEGITSELKRLVKAGAKQIAVVNLPSLGNTPLAQIFNKQDKLNLVTFEHNNFLKEEIKKLESVYPEVQWLYFDVDQIFDKVMKSPSVYGFTNVAEACYKNMARNVNTQRFTQQSVVGYSANLADLSSLNCAGYLFFDLLHPTVEAHTLVAKAAKDLLNEAGVTLE